MLDYTFPDVGEGIVEGTLIKWRVREGEQIKESQTVAEVETDKAVVEIPSPKSGKVIALLAKEHEVVAVGSVLMRIDDGATTPESARLVPPAPSNRKAPIPSAAVEIFRSTSGQDIPVPVPVPATSTKNILALPAVRKLAKDQGVDLTQITGSGTGGRITIEDLQSSAATERTPPGLSIFEVDASPSVRQYAREQSVDITRVGGSGPHGQILREDVEKAKGKFDTRELPEKASIPGPSVPPKYGQTELIDMTSMRKTIANRMSESVHTAAHFMLSDQADVTDLVRIRETLKAPYAAKGIKLTFLPFMIKACVDGLSTFPTLNSSLDNARQQILLKKFYNVGIAVDTEAGLMVPVIKNADSKPLAQLAKDIAQLAQKAKDRTISVEDLHGGTFTITSFGNIGGQFGAPIINYPEVAILGVGRIFEQPAVYNGQIAIRSMCALSLSVDHRVVDGAMAAKFLMYIKERLEKPALILAELP